MQYKTNHKSCPKSHLLCDRHWIGMNGCCHCWFWTIFWEISHFLTCSKNEIPCSVAFSWKVKVLWIFWTIKHCLMTIIGVTITFFQIMLKSFLIKEILVWWDFGKAEFYSKLNRYFMFHGTIKPLNICKCQLWS